MAGYLEQMLMPTPRGGWYSPTGQTADFSKLIHKNAQPPKPVLPPAAPIQATKPAGMTPPAASAATPSAANGNLVIAAARDTTPYTEQQRSDMAIDKGANMELAARRRRESDALASENGYDVTYDDQGNRKLTSLAPTGIPDAGIGGNVYQNQLDNMQNMRLRSDMLDTIDTMQRDYKNGPSGIGDIPRWQASAQSLNNLMKQAGPGGMLEQHKAQAQGNVDAARMKGQYGMEIQEMANEGDIEQEGIKTQGDLQKQRIASDATLQAKQAELLQKAPEAQQQQYKTLLIQEALNGNLPFDRLNEMLASMSGTAKNDVFTTNLDELTGTLTMTNKNQGGVPQVYTKDQLAELARIQQLRGR